MGIPLKKQVKGGMSMGTHPKRSMNQGITQHKCYWGGGDQGTLSLRQCDPDPAYNVETKAHHYSKGGFVTRGSAKEKSRLKGEFSIR